MVVTLLILLLYNWFSLVLERNLFFYGVYWYTHAAGKETEVVQLNWEYIQCSFIIMSYHNFIAMDPNRIFIHYFFLN